MNEGGAHGRLVEELLHALNEFRGEKYRYRFVSVDMCWGKVIMELWGGTVVGTADLDEITRVLASHGARLDNFYVEVSRDKLLLTLVIMHPSTPRRAGVAEG